MIDPNGIASGASGTPIGLVNPAGGRFASLSWRAEECYSSILDNLRFIKEESEASFFANNGVLRPALDDEIASKMLANYSNRDWPKGWISWLNEKELKEFHPGISCIGGGVWLPIGLTVDIPTYLSNFANVLSSKGVSIITGSRFSLSKKNNEWELGLKNGDSIVARHIIFCTGSSITKEEIWSPLPVHPVKGQLAILKTEKPLPFAHAISALGYIASLTKNTFVVGSTYEHKFDHTHPDDKGLEYLLNRFNKVLPELAKGSTFLKSWSGIRLSTPNRKPILGHHLSLENCSVYCGLASKGLLYSAYLAKLMAEYLLDKKELPKEVSIQRLQA